MKPGEKAVDPYGKTVEIVIKERDGIVFVRESAESVPYPIATKYLTLKSS